MPSWYFSLATILATVHEKILEGENFDESSLIKQIGWKILVKVFGYFIVLIDIGEEKFDKSSTICQIHQNFPTLY